MTNRFIEAGCISLSVLAIWLAAVLVLPIGSAAYLSKSVHTDVTAGTTTYVVSFAGGMQPTDDIEVWVNGTEAASATVTWLSGSTLQLNGYTPVEGDDIEFRRVSPKDDNLVDLEAGKTIRAVSLMKNFRHTLQVAQEAWDKSDADSAAAEAAAYAAEAAISADIIEPTKFAYNVDSVEALRLTPATEYTTAYLRGHTSVGDGGHGTFRWDASSTAADDNGVTIAVTGAATGRWVRQPDGYITPGMFGAAGDGVTNDSVAVQACIEYARDNSIEIRLLSKTYIIGDIDILPANPLPGIFSSGVTFNGGSDNSDWVAANTLGGSIFRAAPGSTYMFKIGDRDTSKLMGRTIFKNLTMDGVDRTRGGAILHSNGYATKLENVHITHFDYGFVPVLCDRLNMDKVYFSDNQYGLYVDTTIHGTDINSSGNSLKDVHHRKNDYNMYFKGDSSDFQYNLRGGYWSGSNKGDFVITGCMTSLVLDGVNLENASNGSSLTKPAVFTIGQISAGSHTGIRLLAIENCLIRDNNTVSGNIPVLMKIVDSLNTSKPSIHRLVIRDSIILNYTNGLVVDSVTGAEVTASHIGKGIWDSNHCPVAVPPLKSTIWNFTQEASSIGNGNPEAYGVRQYSCPTFMPTLNRTASLTTRTAEVGGFYTNEGASGAVTFTLDNAPVGSEYTFTCIENGRLIRVTPYTGTQLIGSSGIDKYMDLSTTVGSSVTVTRVSLTSAKSWAVRINSGSVTFAP